MSTLRKHGFKIAVLALCAVMAVYLLLTYVWKPEEKLGMLGAAADFQLEDIDGNAFSMAESNGKVRLLYFYFANCPDVCPPTTYLLSEVQEKLREQGKLGTEVELVSITFDPVRDTPDVIRTFAERTSVEFDGWHFLRGGEEETVKIAKDYMVGVTKIEEQNTFIHTNVVTLIDKDGNIRKRFSGTAEDMSVEEMMKQLDKLL
ncbi:SCO family protein [Paenibacillus sp. J5C_2022]|uniref:SCO family protein n=1 Tax=Paenibacillus sp. J5C2022 TaxID=2977129 RepID=UPI0021CF2465|nr:SCO family protein [Paenibacillus sp. J5C2022]MCU6709255.1 SCO family protein [Paenibacillus sp. J5C2022]